MMPVEVPKGLTAQATYDVESIRAIYQREIAASNFAHLLTPARLATDKGMAEGLKIAEQAGVANESFYAKRARLAGQHPRQD